MSRCQRGSREGFEECVSSSNSNLALLLAAQGEIGGIWSRPCARLRQRLALSVWREREQRFLPWPFALACCARIRSMVAAPLGAWEKV
jgi:hypothetical protein